MTIKKVYVGNLPYETNEDDVRAHFATCGEIISVALIKDRETGRLRGFGFIEFETQAQAQEAVSEKDGQPFQSKNLRVSLAKEQRSRSSDRRGGGRSSSGGGGNRYW